MILGVYVFVVFDVVVEYLCVCCGVKLDVEVCVV